MSQFDFPRIQVHGIYSTNVGTANNNDYRPGFITSLTASVQPNFALVAPNLTPPKKPEEVTDDEFIDWMTRSQKLPSGGNAFPCEWNYYGDMSIRTVDVRVTAVELDGAYRSVDATRDPLVGGSMHLQDASLCDCNAQGVSSTQVFAEGFLLTWDEKGGKRTFLSRKPTRAVTRWINFSRNVSVGGAWGAAASFSCAIPICSTDIGDNAGVASQIDRHVLPASESLGWQRLAELIRSGGAQGLLFRYNLYFTNAKKKVDGLYTNGRQEENPAFGYMTGTIGPWLKDDIPSITLGRYLVPSATFTGPNDKPPRPPRKIAPAVARVDDANRAIVVDLLNSLPDQLVPPTTKAALRQTPVDDHPHKNLEQFSGAAVDLARLEKFDLGALTLSIRPSSGKPIVIGSISHADYSFAKFIQAGGLLTFGYDKAADEVQRQLQADNAQLVMSSEKFGDVLVESDFMIATDPVCGYLDKGAEPDKPGPLDTGPERDEAWADRVVRSPRPAPSLSVTIHMRRKGKAPPDGTKVDVYRTFEVPEDDTPTPASSLSLVRGSGEFTLRAGDVASDNAGAVAVHYFYPEEVRPTEGDPTVDGLLVTRLLPYQPELESLPEKQIGFAIIYKEIFRYYKLILPAMGKRIDFSDPSAFQTPSTLRYILRTIDPDLWDHHRYMPRTRDLSASRRKLLERFCRRMLANLKHGGDR